MFGKLIGVMLIAGLGVGCSSRGDWAKPGATARLEGSFYSKGSVGRTPAQQGPQCLRDRLSTDFLREELTEQESRIELPKVMGLWRELDLSFLPAPHASFLQANESWVSSQLGPEAIAQCKDLFCVLRKLYDVQTDEEAIRIYSFYKRTGYVLSMKDFVPQSIRPRSSQPSLSHSDQFESWRFPNRKLTDFLFNRQQLEAFSRLSSTLPLSLLHLKSLQRLHRVPARIASDTTDPMQEWDDQTCADYFGSPVWGMIRARRCIDTESEFKHLENDFPKNKESGISADFYLTVSHEIFHAWDTQSGETMTGDLSFSTTPQWLNLSGWHSEDITLSTKEYETRFGQRCSTDSGTTVCLVHDWVVDPAKDGFVGDYATTNPFEDFADTASWVRYNPKVVQEKSPAKASLVSQLFYGGRTFDRAGLKMFYIETTLKKIQADRLEIVQTCAAGVNRSAADASKCWRSKVDESVNQAIALLKASEWEACDFFDENFKEFQSELALKLENSGFDELRKGSTSMVEMTAVRDLHAALLKNRDPREAYLACWNEESATQEDCYRRVLVDAFLLEARPFSADLGEQIDREKQNYLEENSFARVSANTRAFYSQILLGVDSRMKEETQSIWRDCLAQPLQASPQETLKLTPYSGGDHYVHSALLNCINEALPAVVKRVRKGELEARNAPPLSAFGAAYLDSLLLVPSLGFIRQLQSLAQNEEDRARAIKKDALVDRLERNLLSTRKWMDAASTPGELLDLCRNEATQAFDHYFSKLTLTEQLPVRFEALSNIRFNLSAEACKRVIKSERVVKEVGEKENKRWSKVLTEAEQYVLKRAEDLVTDCKARTDGIGPRVKRKQSSCVKEPSNWSVIEAQALVDWDHSPEGRRWSKKRGELQGHFRNRRMYLQKRAVLSLEKGN